MDDEEVMYEATHTMTKEMIAQEAFAEAGQGNKPEECNQNVELRELVARRVQDKQEFDSHVATLRDEITLSRSSMQPRSGRSRNNRRPKSWGSTKSMLPKTKGSLMRFMKRTSCCGA